tara:strand:- start:89 stop:376 length:288 start_codon:yes stop_codon:yes gene_type:complete
LANLLGKGLSSIRSKAAYMAANPAHVIAEVAIEKIGDVVNDPIAIGERKLKRTRSSALNCTYANGIAILVILRAEWSAPRHKHARTHARTGHGHG